MRRGHVRLESDDAGVEQWLPGPHSTGQFNSEPVFGPPLHGIGYLAANPISISAPTVCDDGSADAVRDRARSVTDSSLTKPSCFMDSIFKDTIGPRLRTLIVIHDSRAAEIRHRFEVLNSLEVS